MGEGKGGENVIERGPGGKEGRREGRGLVGMRKGRIEEKKRKERGGREGKQRKKRKGREKDGKEREVKEGERRK